MYMHIHIYVYSRVCFSVELIHCGTKHPALNSRDAAPEEHDPETRGERRASSTTRSQALRPRPGPPAPLAPAHGACVGADVSPRSPVGRVTVCC